MEKPNRFYLPWIDWMKTIGIYLIVLGHFGADYSVYLYVFSVQLFFWISGFLVSPEIGGGVELAVVQQITPWFDCSYDFDLLVDFMHNTDFVRLARSI